MNVKNLTERNIILIRNIFSNTRVLEKALDASALRNKVIANNIANVDTPGFKKSTVSFEEELSQALSSRGIQGRRTREGHKEIGDISLSQIRPQIQVSSSTSMREDGNNVDIDVEMAALAQNQISYHYLVQKLNRELQRIRNVVLEGRR